MFAVLWRLNPAYEEAAHDLGASKLADRQAVVVPIVFPGMIAVALFGFTLSYDEFPGSWLTVGSKNTLPLEIWTMTTNVTSPALYALGTVTTIVSFLVIALASAPSLIHETPRGRGRRRQPRACNERWRSRSGKIELAGVVKRFAAPPASSTLNLNIPARLLLLPARAVGLRQDDDPRMIAGHETPTAGEIFIGGKDVVGKPPVERGTAMMFQSYALFPHLSILDNVAFYLKMRGVGKEERRKALAMHDRGCSSTSSRTACRRSSPAASSSASRWRAR